MGYSRRDDRIHKAYGIQETDDKDPNITGGSSFNIVAVAAMSGVAPSDGKVRLWIQALDQLRKPKGILTDENGNPLVETIVNYKELTK